MWDDWQGAFKGIDRAVSDGLVLKIEGDRETNEFLIKLIDPENNEVKNQVEFPYLRDGLLLISNSYLKEEEMVSPPFVECLDLYEKKFEQKILDGLEVCVKTTPDCYVKSMQASGGGVDLGTNSVLHGIATLAYSHCGPNPF